MKFSAIVFLICLVVVNGMVYPPPCKTFECQPGDVFHRDKCECCSPDGFACYRPIGDLTHDEIYPNKCKFCPFELCDFETGQCLN